MIIDNDRFKHIPPSTNFQTSRLDMMQKHVNSSRYIFPTKTLCLNNAHSNIFYSECKKNTDSFACMITNREYSSPVIHRHLSL